LETWETEAYTASRTLEDGIERIIYRPRQPRFQIPILMQHGMWHGAWLWERWQALLAEWGWESHAFSLPGHAGSPEQRPVALCTLDYYLAFLKAEVRRLPRRPVLLGHSMGGALLQWYLKYVGDNLPAAVLVAPWVSHSIMAEGWLRYWGLDPVGCLLMMGTWTADPLVRNPNQATKALLGPQSDYPAEKLHAQLSSESSLVLYQHNPPFWSPPREVKTPLLWLAAAEDALMSEASQYRSATYYGADYRVIEGAGHNLMLDYNACETAEGIHRWLSDRGVE
jgi:pimeloyl-ACP methyl ester carboxylesterase